MGRIVVTGIGLISAIGLNAEDTRRSLSEGFCGIGHLDLFPSRYAGLMPFGEIKLRTEQLKDKLDAFEKGVNREDLLALYACKQAVADAGLTHADLQSDETALINASTVGGMCLTDELYQDANSRSGGSEYLASYDCAATAIYLQKRFGLNGMVNTINTACSSSANAIAFGANLIRFGKARRVIVGGVDCLAKFTINGFNALHILSPERCRPFDLNRRGLNLGEAAAYLVLEKEEEAGGKNIYAVFSGSGNANDAFHPSSLSENGDGPYLAMKEAIESASLQPRHIDYINAHGTGTENNDEVESRAMIRIFGDVPAFTSTKSNTGHTLGAAGAIEAVFSVFNLVHQEIYPALQFAEPIASTGLIPETTYRKQEIRHVMSNSFGFGGNCTSLIFSKP